MRKLRFRRWFRTVIDTVMRRRIAGYGLAAAALVALLPASHSFRLHARAPTVRRMRPMATADTLARPEPPSPAAVGEVALADVASGGGGVAIMLSLQARGVSKKMVAAATEALESPDRVYATADLGEARVAYEAMAKANYGVVACGGGDGTLAATIHGMRDARRRIYGESAEVALARLPRFALIPLGTGNAMASLVGPPKGRRFGRGGAATVTRVLEALRADCRARAQGHLQEGKGGDCEDALLGTITVPLVEVRDDLLDAEAQEKGAEGCFLAGCGYDSFILDDYSR